MLEIQSLRDSLDNLGKETLLLYLKEFKCEKDEDIAKFLFDYAIKYEEEGISRTFFVMDKNYPGVILGYFSIGLNVMWFADKKQIEDAYDGINLYEDGYRPIYKLFMIGKDDRYSKVFKMDKVFNKNVLGYLRIAQSIIGGDLLYIDCVPELMDYYSKKLGFEYLDEIPEKELIRMIRKI